MTVIICVRVCDRVCKDRKGNKDSHRKDSRVQIHTQLQRLGSTHRMKEMIHEEHHNDINRHVGEARNVQNKRWATVVIKWSDRMEDEEGRLAIIKQGSIGAVWWWCQQNPRNGFESDVGHKMEVITTILNNVTIYNFGRYQLTTLAKRDGEYAREGDPHVAFIRKDHRC